MKLYYILIFVVVLVLAVGAAFFFMSSTIYSSQAVAIEKDKQIGMAPFTDRIDFGDIPAGKEVSKSVVLENAGDGDSNIHVMVWGSIANLVSELPEAPFVLKAGVTQDLRFKLNMPATAEPGRKFSGKIIIMRLPW
jgi:hypothetical protein